MRESVLPFRGLKFSSLVSYLMQLQNVADVLRESLAKCSCWLSVSFEILSPSFLERPYLSNPVSFLSVAFCSFWLIVWLFSLSSSLKLCPSKVLSLVSHNIKFSIWQKLEGKPCRMVGAAPLSKRNLSPKHHKIEDFILPFWTSSPGSFILQLSANIQGMFQASLESNLACLDLLASKTHLASSLAQ